MGIFKTNIQIINKYLKHFKHIFSNKQFKIFSLLIYAMFKDYKRCSLSALASKTNVPYGRCQYFFSESKWSLEDINHTYINLIEKQRTTRSTKNGVLIIDDTSNPKPFARKTEGVEWQYCSPLKREEYCNVVVFSAFSSTSKKFPISFKFYKPEKQFLIGKDDPDFKNKLDLAKDLISDARQHKIKFRAVVFDAWYGNCSDLLKYTHSQAKQTFITELNCNRNVQFYHPEKRKHVFLRVDELVKLVKKFYPHKLKPVKSKNQDGKLHTWWSYSFKGLLKGCSVPLKVVVIFGRWNEQDDKDVHVFVTNDTSMSAYSLISSYLLRWGIEQIFRELKDTFGFDQYQVRHQKQIERYWSLCILAWGLVYWLKQNGYLKKILRPDLPLSSFNDYKKAIDSLITFSSQSILSKNKGLRESYFPIRSKRFIANCLMTA